MPNFNMVATTATDCFKKNIFNLLNKFCFFLVKENIIIYKLGEKPISLYIFLNCPSIIHSKVFNTILEVLYVSIKNSSQNFNVSLIITIISLIINCFKHYLFLFFLFIGFILVLFCYLWCVGFFLIIFVGGF